MCRPRLRERVNIAIRLFDHQVDIERQRDVRFERPHDWYADGDIWDECPSITST